MGFYKGVAPPFVVSGLYNASLFSINQFFRQMLTPSDQAKGQPLALWRVAAAGSCTAPFTVAVLTPMEVIKVRLQLQMASGQKAEYKGMLDCLTQILHTEGPRTLFTGYLPTALSRIIGLPFYFSGYELSKSFLAERYAAAGRDVPDWIFMVSGAAGGYAFWTACYPCDLIKTRVQSAKWGTTGPMVELRHILKTKGFFGLYTGFTACLIRSAPANASVWYGIEKTSKYLENHGL